MLFLKSHSSGSLMNYRTLCTSSEDRLCSVFADLPLWNEIFWQVGLELRELSPGQLSLVERRCADVSTFLSYTVEKSEAATLLCHLLSHHHCFVSVHLNHYVFRHHHKLICDALLKSPGLTKLTFCGKLTNASQSFAAALPHLKHLQELQLSYVPFNRTSLEGLSELLASTRSLTTLTMSDQIFEGDEAVVVLRGLGQNVTISTLSLHISLLNTVSPQCGDIFADYLRCNQTLLSLTLTSSSCLIIYDLRPIVGALFCNNILSELKLIEFALDRRSNMIITDMLSRNRGLKRFHMDCCIFYGNDCDMNTPVPIFWSGSSLIPYWLAALAENNTLEELTMGVSWVKPQNCSSFFRALACHTSLKKVNVQTCDQYDVVQICRVIRDTGAPERFVLRQLIVSNETATVIPECKEVSRISQYWHNGDEVALLRTILPLLPACSHVKSVVLQMTGSTFNGEVSSLIEQYLTDTTALRKLRLEIDSENLRSVDLSEQKLLQALSKNKSIRKLSLKGLCISEGEARMLVDKLESSRTLCRLYLYPYNCEASTWFVQMLSPNVSSNYMLLSMRTCWTGRLCGGWFPIKDVVRRNNSLVTRAAHFVMGTRHKYCAAAAELMQHNHELVVKVQELASVDENEAVSRIEDSLKSFTELDDFMRLAGVVECFVTCHRRDDGQKQLVDLNPYCWLHIRQFLKVGDIPDPK
ncbi:hypothetical protein HPB52_009635 [Rhipicephalus sanguineus]|uniref:Nlr family card domain protein n=1 Tax=Rhipicephalus sanguineus TaxID=34632 RepID=A0A9D4SSB3_RHISA|nr:hypothetical protein HPB52_009635 [Rhipicephalus sanguineus]